MPRVNVEIVGHSSEFTAAIKGCKQSLSELKELAVGYIGFEMLKGLSDGAMNTASDLVNTSTKLDITIEQVQVLKKVAADSGTEFENLAKSIGKIAILRDKAIKGDKDAMNILVNAGADKSKVSSMSPEEILFKSIGDKVKSSSFDKIALPMSQALGKSFSEILPALKQNVDETSESMKKMGLLMDAQTAVALKNLKESFDDLGSFIDITFGTMLVGLVDSLMDSIGKNGSYLNEVFAGLKGWAQWFKGQHENALPDYKSPDGQSYSAESRKDSAINLLDFLQAETDKMKTLLPNAGSQLQQEAAYNYVASQIKKPMMDQSSNNYDRFEPGLFADYKGDNIKDLQKYLQGIIQPVQDAQSKIWKGVDDTDKLKSSISDMIQAYKDRITARANQLDNPINGETGNDTSPMKGKGSNRNVYSDSFTSIGNMLGQSFGNMSHVVSAVDLQKQANTKFDKMLEQMMFTNVYLKSFSQFKPAQGFNINAAFGGS